MSRPITTPIPAPDGWIALRYHGQAGDRAYTCPRCERGVAARTQHVVAWPSEHEDRRRHWHSGCWEAASREGLDRYRWG